MDISAIIYAAIGGGGGAAFGVLLFTLFQKLRGEVPNTENGPNSGIKGGLVGGLAVAGGIGVGALYDNMTLPRIVPMDDSALIAETPIYGVIKEQSPEAYERILVPVDRAARNGAVTQEDLNEMRATYFELIEKKMKVANGATLKSIDQISEYQNQVLREKAPRICTLILNGEPFPALDEYFSEEEQKKEQNVMVKLFTDNPRDSEFVPDLERGKVLFEDAFLQPMTEMGITDIRPDPSENAGNDADHRKICDLAIAYSKNKQAMNDADMIHITEYLNSL